MSNPANIRLKAALALALFAAAPLRAGDDFYKYTSHNPDLPEYALNARDFAAPSGFAKPQTWWHWLNGNVSREGIEADLREMADKGYGFARIFSINASIEGPVKFASQEWLDTFKFTVETAAKHGMGIGIHNCDGWSEAGGPWITPELSMKELTLKTLRVTGDGSEQSIALPALARRQNFVRDIAVLAWPAKRPALLAMHRPGVLRRAYPANGYTAVDGGRREFVPAGQTLAIAPDGEADGNAAISGDFTFAVTVSPSADRKPTRASSSGIAPGGVAARGENFVLDPEGMHEKTGDMQDACAGLSVGRNSIAVFEHGDHYFNSILVWDHPVASDTRVAVVYKNNLPALYVNGRRVAVAEKSSGRAVHPPSVLRTDFQGRVAGFVLEPAALSGAEVTALAARPAAAAVEPASVLASLFDGRRGARHVRFSHNNKRAGQFCGVALEFEKPFEASALSANIHLNAGYHPQNVFLECSDDGGEFERVCELKFIQSDLTARFPARKARFWRLVRHPGKNTRDKQNEIRVSEIELLAPGEVSRSASPIDNFTAKAGSATAATDPSIPLLAAPTTAPFPQNLALRPSEIQNLTALVSGSGGTLRWRVPVGEWVVMRVGYTTTGRNVTPATKAGRGLEVDKFEASAVTRHFDSFDRKMIEAAGPLAGETFSIIETDSWEAGHQNWSENFAQYFREQNGYDIIPWLPLYAGECIENVDTTERFLNDLRRTFSALVMGNFYGQMGSLTRAAGLKYETEPTYSPRHSGIYMRDPMSS
ncbi:MAG: hypothetical protein LBM92_01165, partial [Opitutaceae bacterium]|nr:hypothetical protein [Opitutaceae bacterium]